MDDFLPRAHLKRMFRNREISSSNDQVVTAFCNKFIVERVHVLAYLKHIEMLHLKKVKRSEKTQKLKQSKVTQITQNDEGGVENEMEDDTEEESDNEEIVMAVVDDTDDNADQNKATCTRRGRTHTTYFTRHFFDDSE